MSRRRNLLWTPTHRWQRDAGQHISSTLNIRRVLGDSTLPLNYPLCASGINEWPLDILFDAVYGSAVLHHFSTQELKEEEVNGAWNATFYLSGVMSTAHEDYTKLDEKCDTEK